MQIIRSIYAHAWFSIAAESHLAGEDESARKHQRRERPKGHVPLRIPEDRTYIKNGTS